MTPKQLRTLFLILHNLDKKQLEDAGVIRPGANGGSDWTRFNSDIGTFVIKLSDDRLERLSALLKAEGL